MHNVIYFTAAIGLISCLNNPAGRRNVFSIDKEGRHCISEYYADGNIKSTKIWIDSAAQTYAQIDYDTSGYPIDSLNYERGKLNGMNYLYVHDTLLITEYLEGIESGVKTAFYPNGETMYFGNMIDGKQIGGWKFFHSNSELESYEYFNLKGERMFLVHFSETGEVEKCQGYVILGEELHFDTITKREGQFGIMNLANPVPECTVSCSYGISNIDGSVTSLRVMEIDSADYALNREGKIEYLCDRKGPTSMQLLCNVTYKDSIILRDTAYVKYFVK